MEEDLTLGPFYWDGTEILPCTTEATDKAIEETMGNYCLMSNVPTLQGMSISITNRLITEYIQADWDRVTDETNIPAEGFLLAYLSSPKAIGRLAEDLISRQVFKEELLSGDPIDAVISVSKAIEEGKLVRVKDGVRCDDLLALTRSGRKHLAEVKASFTGKSYLSRALPKAVEQLRSTLQTNSDVEGVLFLLISIREKFAVVLRADRQEVMTLPSIHWKQAYVDLHSTARAR